MNKNNGFPAGNNKPKQALATLIEELNEQPGMLDTLLRIRTLPDPDIPDHQWQITQALFTLLPVAAAELQLLFRDNNIADYTELAQRADLALGNSDSPSDLALAFDYRLQHILMDEFQDTSTGQIELLQKLLAGWEQGDGRTAFFVGDPMQSIYRFREAEVGIFLDVQKNGIEGVLPQPLLLECNFRSAPSLIEWFNGVFPSAMPADNNVSFGAVRYTPAIAFRPQDSHSGAMVHPGIDRTAEQEASEVVDLIATTLQRFPEESIAILGRARLGLQPIVSELESRGIEYEGIKLQHLAEREAIQDLISLTLALCHPGEKIAWLGLLRAPWVGASLDDCLHLMADTPGDSVLTALENISLNPNLSAHFISRASHLLTVLRQGRRNSANMPLQRNLEACWLRLGGAATCPTEDIDNCQLYFQMIADMVQRNMPVNRNTLEPALAELYARPAHTAKVKILTIHASKGLEFDTVVLPGLQRRGRGEDPALLRWKKLPDRLLLAPRPASNDSEKGQYGFLGELDMIHQRNETSRLLYVACTRAQKRLHLFASASRDSKNEDQIKAPPATSLLSPLWSAVEQEFVEALAVVPQDIVDMEIVHAPEKESTALARLPENWTPPIAPPGLTSYTGETGDVHTQEQIEYEWARELARISGIVIHRQLQEIDRIGWEKWCQQGCTREQKNRWRVWLLQNGLPPGSLNEAMNLVEKAMKNAMQDSAAAWIFSDQHREIQTEWPLTGTLDGVVRRSVIDRSFIDQEDIRWIIDFKGSRHDDERDIEQFLASEVDRYRSSMLRYATIIGNMEQRKIATALYFPLLKKLVTVS